MADETETVSFSITLENGRGPKNFSLLPGSKKIIRIGRAPGNDMQVELRGSSQYHAEIRLVAAEDEDEKPRLMVRDLSMNGTGIKRFAEKPAVQCPKGEDQQLYHGTQILVPFNLKATQSPEDRAWLRVNFDDPEVGGEPPEEEDEPAEKKAAGSDDDEDDDEDDAEKTRMQFVDLLMKTRDISAGTSYEEAGELLGSEAQWKAVDEQTRKECFDIFVEHLGSHSGKKNKKKDKKEKGKSKKRKHDDDEEEEESRGAKRGKKEKKSKRRAKESDSD